MQYDRHFQVFASVRRLASIRVTMKTTTVQCVLLVLSSCLLANAARNLQEGKPP